MPYTLYRYILWDVLRLLALSTVALLTVISFAAAIKPLSEGLLGPGAVLKFVLFTTPTMLQYTLPFSTAFAVTLTFARLVADNEVTAMVAGGMSYAKILLPISTLGALLMILLFVMSNWIVPTFNQQAMGMIQKDVIKLTVSQLQKGETVTLGDWVVYADNAKNIDDPALLPKLPDSDVQPDQAISLQGVSVGEIDPDTQQIIGHGTAEQAHLLVFRQDGRIWVQFNLENAEINRDNVQGSFDSMEQVPSIPIDRPLVDKPRAMSWAQLRELSQFPDRYDRIHEAKRTLVERLAEEELLSELESGLQKAADERAASQVSSVSQPSGTESAGADTFGLELKGAIKGERYVITAPVATREGAILKLPAVPNMPIRIDHFQGDKRLRRYEARGGGIVKAEFTAVDAEPRAVFELTNVLVLDGSLRPPGTERKALRLTRMYWHESLVGSRMQMPSQRLLMDLNARDNVLPEIKTSMDYLRASVDRLLSQIVGEFHLRAAIAFGCLIATILGAVLSIHLRGNIPLVTFFWTFLCVLGSLVLAYAGKRLVSDPEAAWAVGLIVLWGGNVAMAGVLGWTFAKLR